MLTKIFSIKSLFTGAALMAGAMVLTPTASALGVGDEAPCVILEQVQADGSSTEGCIRDVLDPNHQFTLIEFFSITCSACHKNLPKVSALSKEVEATTTMRLVSIDRNEEKVREYVEKKSDLIRFPVAFDVERDAKRAYDVVSTPTIFVLDRDYVVRYKNTGVLSEDDLDELRQLLSE